MEVKEIELSVSWGTVAGKAWGSESLPRVVAFHGLGDNACSFDNLIPLLPKTFHYVCVDFPGHGRSSRLPEGCQFSEPNLMRVMDEILEKVGGERQVILAHSFGALLALFFAIVYKKRVEKLILLDAWLLNTVEPEEYATYMHKHLEKVKKGANKVSSSSYTKDQCLEIMQFARSTFSKFGKDEAETIFSRSVYALPGGKFKFAMDSRMSDMKLCLSRSYVTELFASVEKMQNVFVVLSSDAEKRFEKCPELLRELKLKTVYLTVRGNHYFHLNSPEDVAPTLISCLEK